LRLFHLGSKLEERKREREKGSARGLIEIVSLRIQAGGKKERKREREKGSAPFNLRRTTSSTRFTRLSHRRTELTV
jgi:hypothetical protein